MAFCQAHTKTGKHCKAQAVSGATVCRMHGGAAPQTQRRARERVAVAEAQRMVARAGVDQDPIAHLLDSLHLAAQLCAVWGVMVAGLDETAELEAEANDTLRGELGYRESHANEQGEIVVTSHDRLLALNQSGMAHIHPYVIQYEKAIERVGRLAKLCLDAGVEQRRVEIEQERASMMADIFRRVFDDPELELTAQQRKTGLGAAARQLRLVAGTA